MAVLRSAQIVVRVGVDIEHAVRVVVEDVRASTHRSAGDLADLAEVALREAEGVVVVVEQAHITVVVQRSNLHLELIDRSGGQLGGGQGHAVVAGLDNTFDMVSGFAGLDTDGVVSPAVAELLSEEVGDGSGSNFLVDAVVGDVVAVGLDDLVPQVSGVGSFIAPHGNGSREVFRAVAFHNVVRNGLCELFTRSLERSPESIVLLLGVEVVGGVAVGTSSEDDVDTGIHTAAVLVDADDRHGVERCGAVIGRVHVDVHVEDDVVDGHRGAVGEGDVVTQGDGIGNSAVFVLGDNAVGRAIVGVVVAVVLAGLAFDAVEDHLAAAVSAQQSDLRQSVRVLVGSGSCEERAELAFEAGLSDDDGTVSVGFCGRSLGGVRSFGGFRSGRVRAGIGLGLRLSLGAAGKQANAENDSQKQRKDLLGVFHFLTS